MPQLRSSTTDRMAFNKLSRPFGPTPASHRVSHGLGTTEKTTRYTVPARLHAGGYDGLKARATKSKTSTQGA